VNGSTGLADFCRRPLIISQSSALNLAVLPVLPSSSARSDMPMHELYAPGEATSLVCSLHEQPLEHLKLSMTWVALKTMSSPALQTQHSNETSAAKIQV